MSSKLWFVSDGANLVGVFNSRREAELEEQRYEDDPDYDYFEFYSIDVDELEDYPDEYEMASENGYI